MSVAEASDELHCDVDVLGMQRQPENWEHVLAQISQIITATGCPAEYISMEELARAVEAMP